MRLVTTLTLSLLLAPAALAQPCDPADASEPCPDTTTAHRYFPLEVGNQWQYRDEFYDEPAAHWSWRITGETEIGGQTYFELVRCDEAEDGSADCVAPVPIRYDAEHAMIVRRDGDAETWWNELPCLLDVDFNGTEEAYECTGPGTEDGQFTPAQGSYGATVEVPPDILSGDTRKEFSRFAYQDWEVYAGLGVTAFRYELQGEPTRLVHAIVGGEQVGTPAFATCDPSDFESDIACPDTTDWRRYFPLAVGNEWQFSAEEWQYNFYSYGYRVVGDAIIEGTPHFMVRRCEAPVVGDFFCGEPVPVRYAEDSRQVVRRTEDGSYEPWLGFQAPSTRTLSAPLNAPFCGIECVCEPAGCGDEDGSFVEGEYGGGWSVGPVGDTRKWFYPNGSLIEFDFVAGVGLVYETNGLDEATLVYAELDGVAYGNPEFTFPNSGEPGASAPAAFALHSVYPNPAREAATVAFTLDRAQDVTLELLDVLGRVVRTEEVGAQAAGPHEARLATDALPSGLYLVRLRGDGAEATRRLVVLR